MRVEPVEIYSDASNHAVMRHPGRKFPGSLVQGDTLHILTRQAETIRSALHAGDRDDALIELDDLIEKLRSRLDHYSNVLREHGISLPFYDADPKR